MKQFSDFLRENDRYYIYALQALKQLFTETSCIWQKWIEIDIEEYLSNSMDMLNSSLGGFTGACFFRQRRLSLSLPRGGRLCTPCPPRRPFGGRRMGSGSGAIDFWRRQEP